jgi:hypothetical protein
MNDGWLDWREHRVGPARPCRICARPAICRDAHDRPCHKVCAERRPADLEAGPDALVIDLATYRAAHPSRRTA